MIRRPPRSTRTTHSFPTRRSSDLDLGALAAAHALLLRLAAPLARLAAAMYDVARYCIGAGPAWHGMAAARALAPVCPRCIPFLPCSLYCPQRGAIGRATCRERVCQSC